MGLDTLQSHRDRAKLKWWYKLATLPEDRYPKQLFNQKWNIKPHRGRQRKVCDAGSRLLFKFRSGTHGLNEELGRHRGREGKTECSLCGNECENVSHVLLECSAYSSTRALYEEASRVVRR